MPIIKGNNGFSTEMPALFSEFLTRDFWNWRKNNNSVTNTTIPAINVKENNEYFYVEVAAPGMKKDDFIVELNGTTLTIASEKEKREEEKEGEFYSRKEFSYQSFRREFELAARVVDVDRIQAKYDNGILHLTLPKKNAAKQSLTKTIQIL